MIDVNESQLMLIRNRSIPSSVFFFALFIRVLVEILLVARKWFSKLEKYILLSSLVSYMKHSIMMMQETLTPK